MRFKQFFENSSKRVLVLIHPECCSELGSESAKKYIQLLKEHAPKFDYVITHAFTSGTDWIDQSYLRDEDKESWRDSRNVAESISDVFLWNPKDMYGCSYSKELPDYLIENPKAEIYMAGGYENNCLWIAYQQLFEKLKWVLDENKTLVHYYKPLIFVQRQHSGVYPEPSNYRDFHPSKVSYKD